MAGFKLPKSAKDVKNAGQFDPLAKYNKTIIDPLGIGVGDAVYGKNKGPDYSKYTDEQARALAEARAAGDEYIAAGPASYSEGDELTLSQLGAFPELGDTNLADITTDPRFADYELAALAELEEQSQNGYTARDQADLVRIESEASRANRGRQGAIQQNMAARGLGGSGLDFIAQTQAAQDSIERQALEGLEKNAQLQERKQSATARLGSLGSELQSKEYAQKASAAQAQDNIDRFNASMSIDRNKANTNLANEAATQNWSRSNATADRNVGAAADFRGSILGVKQKQAGINYDSAADRENRARLQAQENEQAAAGKIGMLGGVAGGVVGGIYGGPAGATAGSKVGQGVGGEVGRTGYRNTGYYAHGGKVPGQAQVPGDHPVNDTEPAWLSPDEIVIPRSISDDPAAAAEFVARENGQDSSDDLVGSFLRTMEALTSKRK